MKTIGITGGIGSGKSLICEMFKILGIPVFHADIVAKDLINTSDKVKSQLIEKFGDGIYEKSGFINKQKFGDIIFNDKLSLTYSNSIIHPEVVKKFNEWKIINNNSKYVLHEAAILFESGVFKNMDMIIYVSAPIEVRIKRVIQRDNTTARLVKERIENQWGIDKVRDKIDFIINNDGLNLIIPQVLQIHESITKE